MVTGVISDEFSDVERRVWARLPPDTRAALDRLPATDLQTLLLSVARTRAARVRPTDLLRRWREDRFVRPSAADPRALAAVVARMWQLLPADIEGVELSPVVPLGTCSAVGPVSQNRVVTTARSTEVLSDPTNALALEAADRRRRRGRAGSVHLAASHRQLRAQRFGPGMSAHFPLFSLVSSARDEGSGRTQAELLTRHLGYWQRVLAALIPSVPVRLRLAVHDNPVLRERLADTVGPALPDGPRLSIVDGPEPGRLPEYYRDAALKVFAEVGDGIVELGDGGFTTWTAQLMGDAKECCFVSCLSTERLLAIRPGP
jgi:hypothetical protein